VPRAYTPISRFDPLRLEREEKGKDEVQEERLFEGPFCF
jgi:hypothetical protein